MSGGATPSANGPAGGAPTPLHTVQVGMGWPSEQPGGLNRVFAALVAHLPAEGVEVRGLVAGSAAVERDSGGAVRAFAPPTVPMWRRIAAVRRALDRMLHARGDEVLVSHFAPYGVGMLDASRWYPFVVYFHGPWAGESRAEGRGRMSGWLRGALEQRVYARAHACIVLSRAFGELLEREYGVAPARIHVIPGGVDCARFADLPPVEDARRALGWPLGDLTVLAVRRLVKRTGVDRLIAAVPALRARVPGVRVMVAGDGPEREALEAQARALGVADAVRFLGFLPDDQLPLAYHAADLSVVPSVALEGFGLVVAESLAAGTPAMVTPVGGLPEVVEGLSPQLVLRDATAEAIAEGLADGLTGARPLPSPERCAAFARAHFDWPVVARQVAELLRRVQREFTP